MPRYRLAIMGADSNDIEVYEQLAAAAKERGFDGMSLGILSETTLEQEQTDSADPWLRFSGPRAPALPPHDPAQTQPLCAAPTGPPGCRPSLMRA